MEYEGYKYLFVDVDGTMLTSQKDVSQKTQYCFDELKKLGVEVVIASGRQRSNILKIADLVNSGRYVISANGADVFDRTTNTAIYSESMPKDKLLTIFSIVKKHNLRIRIICGSSSFVNKDIRNPQDEQLLTIDENEFFETHSVPQCVVYFDNYDVFEEVKNEIKALDGIKILNQNKSLSRSQKEFFMDIASANTSKGNGIVKLCKATKINPLETVAIGDDENDISMFDVCGVAVAMENSSDKTKSKANIITLSNNDDGIYNAVINLFDIEEFYEEE